MGYKFGILLALFAGGLVTVAKPQQQANYELAEKFNAFDLGGKLSRNSLAIYDNADVKIVRGGIRVRDHKHRDLAAKQSAAFGNIFADRGRNVFGFEGIGESLFEITKCLTGTVFAAERPVGFAPKFFNIIRHENISFRCQI